MNLDKTIKELSNRLDVVYPYSSWSSWNEIRHDGINYWKGKKIISAKKWNEIYEKNSTYTDNYRITLISRKPLQYFPDDYNGTISSFKEELREEAQKWNNDYYELLEYKKNPTLGRNKCIRCILSTHLDDPLFVGIGKVIARIISNHCKNNNLKSISNVDNDLVSYPCRVMNFFQCPFESNNNQYPYTKEQLFALQGLAFVIEQAITTFFETTKNNEIIYEVDFVNDRVQEIHTNYNGEPESWGWNENVKEQLVKVKPISNIVIIRDEQDIYNILTNREKLECLMQEYVKENNHQLEIRDQVCCDENTTYVPKEDEDNNSNNKKTLTANIIESLVEVTEEKKQQQLQHHVEDEQEYSHKGENPHSKNTEEDREQQILLKDNKEAILDFLSGNKDSIRIEDLKVYEPVYKCYIEKRNCIICNALTNIVCINCNDYNYYNNKEIWICTNHWQQHTIEKHE